MKKYIFLFLLVMNSSMHAMERYSFSGFLSSLYSYLFSDVINQVSRESEVIQNLRISRNKFAEKLNVFTLRATTHDLFNSINDNPVLFLEHCYHQRFWWRNFIVRSDVDIDLIDRCKKAQIDGYSALGAACIARDMPIGYKRDFIRPLMDHGFELTEKDRALAIIELYDAISAEQKKEMIFLLFILGQGNFAILPHELGKYIVYYMMYSFKKEVWPLPDDY